MTQMRFGEAKVARSPQSHGARPPSEWVPSIPTRWRELSLKVSVLSRLRAASRACIARYRRFDRGRPYNHSSSGDMLFSMS
jgi:hypothetical protein